MGTATELMQSMQRRAALAVLENVAAQDAAARRRHCGEVADFDGFEDALAKRLQEKVE
jgi:hypothetical protein